MRPTSPDTVAADPPAKPVTRSKPAPKTTAFEEHHSSRKREREGSLEPSTQQTPTKVDPVPAKKNRLQDDALAEEAETADAAPVGVETEKVGQIRKKVDAMSTGEKTAAPTDNGDAQASAEPPAPKVAKFDTATTSPPPLPAASKPEASSSTSASTSPPPLPARTQPTFSSFSSKASPFSAVPTSSGSSGASSSKNSFAAFSAKNTASPTPRGFGGIKPSDLGSSIGGKHDAAPVPTPTKSVLKGPSLGFGAFAGASPLSKAKSPTPSTPQEPADPADKESEDGAAAKSTDDAPAETFEQKLLREQDPSTTEEAATKTLLPDTPEVDGKFWFCLTLSFNTNHGCRNSENRGGG